MAERIGLFSSPEEVRDLRLAQIRKLQQESAPKGFNFGVSLGQGMRESANNMLGITNPMEAKAAELQAMMQSVDPTNPDALANIAKMMNELGYTKEAIAILERRNQVVAQQSQEEEAATKKAQGKTRTVQKVVMRPMQIGSGKDAQVVQVPMQVSVTQEWKDGAWVDIMPDTASTAADGKYGGITVIDPKTGMTTLKQGDPAVDGFTEDLTISP
jgi:hypothetical protein